MPSFTNDLTYLGTASAAGLLAAVFDLRSRRIPNLLTGTSLVLGMGLHLWLGGMRDMGAALLAGLLAGSAFFLFYLAGGMGAGDVKLMAAVACLSGWPHVLAIVTATVICGALLAIGIALRHGCLKGTLLNALMLIGYHRDRGLVAHPQLNASNSEGLRMPFAVPIAAGCLASIYTQIWRG